MDTDICRNEENKQVGGGSEKVKFDYEPVKVIDDSVSGSLESNQTHRQVDRIFNNKNKINLATIQFGVSSVNTKFYWTRNRIDQ